MHALETHDAEEDEKAGNEGAERDQPLEVGRNVVRFGPSEHEPNVVLHAPSVPHHHVEVKLHASGERRQLRRWRKGRGGE